MRFLIYFFDTVQKDDFKRQKHPRGKDNNAKEDYKNGLFVAHDISHRIFNFHLCIYINYIICTLKIKIILILIKFKKCVNKIRLYFIFLCIFLNLNKEIEHPINSIRRFSVVKLSSRSTIFVRQNFFVYVLIKAVIIRVKYYSICCSLVEEWFCH